MTFPVIHSTLDPVALRKEIESRYDLGEAVRCRMMNRANNDFYIVESGGDRYALRVAKADFRTRDEYTFEAEYVAHLHAKGCVVPGPVTAADGSLFFEVEAPEGIRTITLLRWVDGVPFTKTLTPKDAEQMGQSLAHLHQAGQGFVSSVDRKIDTAAILQERIPHLLELLQDEPAHRDFYERASERVIAAFHDIDSSCVEKGAVHGDYQFANVLRLPDESIGALDFDTCGTGYLAEDILTFVWRSDMEIRNEPVNSAFLRGYESVRPLTSAEREALSLFRVARDLVMSSSYAILINRVGPVSGFDGNFEPFTDLAKIHLIEAGIE